VIGLLAVEAGEGVSVDGPALLLAVTPVIRRMTSITLTSGVSPSVLRTCVIDTSSTLVKDIMSSDMYGDMGEWT
jgi:hypothetical protein